METQLTDRVDFGFIRYANCWEDADILLEGLDPKPGQKHLSIGSAGDNSFSLLITDPELVVAVDVNPVQLYLIELKKVCIQHFSREETLVFLGFKEGKDRLKQFDRLNKYLSTEALSYWTANADLIEKGLIHQGKFEKYFQLFCRKILPWIHSKKTIAGLFREKTEEEQQEFYTKKWNTWRWRLLFKVFFSKPVMGKYGRDPEFLREVKVKVSDFIFVKAEQQLKSKQAQRNFILRYNLTSSFGTNYPHYLRDENYGRIKKNIDRLQIYQGYAEDAIQQYGKFDRMNLSNIFEYLDMQVFSKVAGSLAAGCNPQARMAYWNLMVPRQMKAILPDQVKHLNDVSEQLTNKDKGFFYSRFMVDERLAETQK